MPADNSLPLTWITGSLLAAWQTRQTLPVPLLIPGLRAETTAWPEWFELQIERWTPRRARAGDPTQIELRITVHVFVRATTVLGRGQALADVAIATLCAAPVPLVDPAAVEEHIGRLMIDVTTVRDVTRDEHRQGQSPRQHWVCEFVGMARRA